MSLGAPSPPSVGDTTNQAMQLAAQQGAANKDSAIASQAGSWSDQYNPYGSITRHQIGVGPGGVPLYGTEAALTPEQQGLFDKLMGTKQIAGTAGSEVLAGGTYGNGTTEDRIGNLQQGMTKQVMDRQMAYLDPFFTTQRDQLGTKMRNQGLLPGSPAYTNAMRELDTNQGLTVSKASADYAPQAYSQATSTYMLPAAIAKQLAELGAPGSPTQMGVQSPALNLQPANYTAAMTASNTAAMDAYKAQYGQYNDMWSAVGKAAPAAMDMAFMLSDRRLKADVVPLSMLDNGLTVYSYRFLGGRMRHIGLMADEVEQIMPEAVGDYHGFKTVNYALALR